MPASGQSYTVSDLTSTLNISRTTLLYYEQLGIVRPERNGESGYRVYRSRDVFRLMSAIMLKNVGVEPKNLAARLDGEPFSDEHFAEYLQMAQKAVAYHEARLDCLRVLDELRRSVGTLSIVDVEPYYIVYDRAEGGYHDFPDDEGLVSLLANMPIGGLGSRDVADYSSLDRRPHVGGTLWGRTVAVRHAHLIEGLQPERLELIGGCRCVRSVTFQEDIVNPGADSGGERGRVLAYLDEHGLRPAGWAFCPYSLPSDHGYYVPLCLPVEPVDGPWPDGGYAGPDAAAARRLGGLGKSGGAWRGSGFGGDGFEGERDAESAGLLRGPGSCGDTTLTSDSAASPRGARASRFRDAGGPGVVGVPGGSGLSVAGSAPDARRTDAAGASSERKPPRGGILGRIWERVTEFFYHKV